MGIVRLLLAIAVVIAHSTPLFNTIKPISGPIAVEIFFMISGFTITYVLNTKYKYSKQGIISFFKSRFWRIYPLYWTMLVLTIIFLVSYYLIFRQTAYIGYYLDGWTKLNFAQQVFVIVGNTGSIFQGAMNFLFYGDHQALKDFLVIPQGWFISLVIGFYLLAPFLNKLKGKILILILILSLVWRFSSSPTGLDGDPWTDRFFPFELALFIMGMLACRVYLIKPTFFAKKARTISSVIITVTAILAFQFLTIDRILGSWLLYLLVFVNLPFLFAFSSHFKWDRIVGDLSYPLFLTHVFVQTFIFYQIRTNWGPDNIYSSLVFLLISLVIASIINWLVDKLVLLIKKH